MKVFWAIPVVARAKTASRTDENFILNYKLLRRQSYETMSTKQGGMARLLNYCRYDLPRKLVMQKKQKKIGLHSCKKLSLRWLSWNAIWNVNTPFAYLECEIIAYPPRQNSSTAVTSKVMTLYLGNGPRYQTWTQLERIGGLCLERTPVCRNVDFGSLMFRTCPLPSLWEILVSQSALFHLSSDRTKGRKHTNHLVSLGQFYA